MLVNKNKQKIILSLLFVAVLSSTSFAPNLSAMNNQGNLYAQLIEAAKNGNFLLVENLIALGANVNATTVYKWTPLHGAVFNEHLDIVKCLVEHKADVNAKDDDEETPLHLAAEWGYFEIVKYLVEHKADVNAEDNEKWTPLHYAAFYGYLEIVQYLIEHKANVNAKTESSVTPLHRAVEKGHLEIVKYLILNGADLDAASETGAKPADLAKNPEIKEYFKEYFEASSKFKTGTPLAVAEYVEKERSVIDPEVEKKNFMVVNKKIRDLKIVFKK